MTDSRSETLDLFNTYVVTIGNNESKRLQANATYFGFVGALVTVAASVANVNLNVIAALALFLSVIWFFTIRHHRKLAEAKFEVLKSLESELQHQPFQQEWEIYKKNRWPVSLTTIEIFSPLAIGVFCASYFIYLLISACMAIQCLALQ